MAKVAVLTNDLQYDMVNKNQERTDAVAQAKTGFCNFLQRMRELGIPIVHLQLINREDDPTVQRYGDRIPVLAGTHGAEIIEEFLDPRDIVMVKHKDSGFFETELDATLQSMGIETVIVTGMQTQICVQTTAADAHFRGYKVVVPEDGVVSAREEDKRRALEWLASYFAQVTTCEAICAHLETHEDFERKAVNVL